MDRTKILGSGAPGRSPNAKSPMYVVEKPRGDQLAFYFQVPKRSRPEGWPGAIRLPIDSLKRSGRGDAAERNAVAKDAKSLYERLTKERTGESMGHPPGSVPWLIQSFEQSLKTKPRGGRKGPIAQRTLKAYAYAARQVTEWSKEAGHPDVTLITRPAILEFLSTMNANPSKRKFMASYLRTLMFHAMDKGLRTENPAVKLGVEAPDAHVHIWTDDELDQMVAAAEEMHLEQVATAMLIAHDEGPRPVDVLAFQRFRDYTPRDGAFRYFQHKTRDWVVSPAGRRVRERLARQPSEQLMLV